MLKEAGLFERDRLVELRPVAVFVLRIGFVHIRFRFPIAQPLERNRLVGGILVLE